MNANRIQLFKGRLFGCIVHVDRALDEGWWHTRPSGSQQLYLLDVSRVTRPEDGAYFFSVVLGRIRLHIAPLSQVRAEPSTVV